jgi:hypothetical protein
MDKLWSHRRKQKVEREADLQQSGIEHLEELLKCMTVMQEMECASEGWMSWQPGIEDMDCSCGMVLDSTVVGNGNDGVCKDEHAYLDFLTMELGLGEVNVEDGARFENDEEQNK